MVDTYWVPWKVKGKTQGRPGVFPDMVRQAWLEVVVMVVAVVVPLEYGQQDWPEELEEPTLWQ